MNYIKEAFDMLIKGEFVTSNSHKEKLRQIYKDIDDNQSEYSDYFQKIGFSLEEGNGYYYLSRNEKKSNLTEKLARFGHWIDIMDLMTSWQSAFGPDFRFYKSTLLKDLNIDMELKEKAKNIYDGKEKESEILSRIIEEMLKAGFIETIDKNSEEYKVTNAIRYLEELVAILTIDSSEDEIFE